MEPERNMAHLTKSQLTLVEENLGIVLIKDGRHRHRTDCHEEEVILIDPWKLEAGQSCRVPKFTTWISYFLSYFPNTTLRSS
jgi:hypothetical protein